MLYYIWVLNVNSRNILNMEIQCNVNQLTIMIFVNILYIKSDIILCESKKVSPSLIFFSK